MSTNCEKNHINIKQNNIKLEENLLQDKDFKNRESLLTTLFESEQFKYVYNFVVVIIIIIFIENFIYNFFINARIYFGTKLIVESLESFPSIVPIWIVYFCLTIILFYCFKLWAQVRKKLYPKSGNNKLWDTFWLTSLIAFYGLTFWSTTQWKDAFNLSNFSACFIVTEQVRLLMKVHSFVRSNVQIVLNYKQKSDEPSTVPTLKKFLYFSFAPTLIYRDSYPRTKKISTVFTIYRALEVIVIFVVLSLVLERYIIPKYANLGETPLTWKDYAVPIFDTTLVAALILILTFYLILHAWPNFTAEILCFGDRLFYGDWWACTSYPRYYRTWNTLVHDFLRTYIYLDLYIYVFKNQRIAKALVIIISALVHEWILMYSFGFFHPAMLAIYGFFGTMSLFLRGPKNRFCNIWFLYGCFLGNGLFLSLYTIEYFLRRNISQDDPCVKKYLPRTFSCIK